MAERVPLKQLMRASGRRRKGGTLRPVTVRVADEAALFAIYRDELLNPWLKFIRDVLLPAYVLPPKPVLTADSDGQQLDWLLRQQENAINSRLVYQTEKLGVWVTGAGNRNTRQWINGTKSATGVDVAPYFRLGDIRYVLEAQIAENTNLISGVNADVKRRVSQIIFNGFALRKPRSVVAAEIRSAMGTTWRRADLIARDQNHKLNALLNQLRNEQLGIDAYIWRTKLDDRVRGNPNGKYPKAIPSHWIREGKRFLWAKPPVDGHPGYPINCRCVAESLLPD